MADTFLDSCEKHLSGFFKGFLRIIGPMLVLTVYILVGIHLYAFFGIQVALFKKRLGTTFGLVWIAIGLSLLYNLIYNHLLAVFIKPNSVKDLRRIE